MARITDQQREQRDSSFLKQNIRLYRLLSLWAAESRLFEVSLNLLWSRISVCMKLRCPCNGCAIKSTIEDGPLFNGHGNCGVQYWNRNELNGGWWLCEWTEFNLGRFVVKMVYGTLYFDTIRLNRLRIKKKIIRIVWNKENFLHLL